MTEQTPYTYITIDVAAIRETWSRPTNTAQYGNVPILGREVIAEYHEAATDWDTAAERALFLARFAACEPNADLVSVTTSYHHKIGAPMKYNATVVYTVKGIENLEIADVLIGATS